MSSGGQPPVPPPAVSAAPAAAPPTVTPVPPAAVPAAASIQSPVAAMSAPVAAAAAPPAAAPAASASAGSAAPSSSSPSGPAAAPAPAPAPAASPPASSSSSSSGQSQSQSSQAPAAQFRVTMTGPTDASQGMGYRQLKVEDALAYLDKVKTQFASKPHIYNKFLEIMKAFKAQTIDTPGVIRRVSELFKGHNNLILGFNTFLPPGYKIELVPSSAVAAPAPAPAPPAGASSSTTTTSGGAAGATGGVTPTAGSGSGGFSGAGSGSGAAPRPPVRMPPPPVRTGPGAGPLEFDHAISYVTKIKRRFASDPSTYKAFLEILHTYQKQQRSIKDVLERVSVLFKDHADLLRDFTYFLPDAVQDAAKERIQRIAEDARRAAAKQAAAAAAKEKADAAAAAGGAKGDGAAAEDKEGGGGGKGAGRDRYGGFPAGAGPSGYSSRGATLGKDRERLREADRDSEREFNEREAEDRMRSGGERERDRERERMVDRQRDRLTVGMGPGKSPRMAVVARRRRAREEEMHLTLTPSERSLFARIKAALGAREPWAEFLKCLDLYASEVLSRAELLTLLADVLGPSHAKLLEELRSLLTNRGTLEMTPEDIWYSMPVGEVDFSQCPRCTPSYRALPSGYPKLACTERSKMEQEHLNDVWVSVPTGSEDFSFKIMRKNAYEDALFRCEDDRYELDMVIDNNSSAIRALEPLAEEIAVLKEHAKGVEWQFRLDRRSLGVLHLKAIARVYGDYGGEVLELLRKNPGGAIPIILARLKQKDEEWRRVRIELSKGWKEVMEKNYYRSLDHRSFYFKQADRKAITSKALVGEMRAKVEALEAAIREYIAAAAEAAAEGEKAAADREASAKATGAGTGVGDVMEVEGEGGGGKKEEVAADDAAPKQPEGIVPGPNGTSSVAPDRLPPAFRAKLRGLAPTMHFMYRDVSMHRDAYSVLAYAVEKGIGASREEKQAVADVWRTFMTRFFAFPPAWTAAVPALAHAGEGPVTTSAGLLPMGTAVTSPYGIAVVEGVRLGQPLTGDNLPQSGSGDVAMSEASGSSSSSSQQQQPIVAYHVMLTYGRAVLDASIVKPLALPQQPALASGGKVKPLAVAPSALAAVTSSSSGADVTFPSETSTSAKDVTAFSTSALALAERLTSGASSSSSSDDDGVSARSPPECVWYAGEHGYVFARLHQMLVDRLTTAKLLCARGAAGGGRGVGALAAAAAKAKSSAAAAATAPTSKPGGGVVASLAPGAQAAARGHDAGKSTAAAAAAVGDLAAAAAAGAVAAAGAGGDAATSEAGEGSGDVSMGEASGSSSSSSFSSAVAAAADSSYDHFLTALYALIDGSMESGRFEDECRELMGTGAYLLFTLDKLVTSAAKQLVVLTRDPPSQRLRALWEYTQARLALARATVGATANASSSGSGSSVEAAVAAELANYRTAVATALAAGGGTTQEKGSKGSSGSGTGEPCYAIQYCPPSTSTAASAESSSAASSSSSGEASLSIRFVGRPLLDASRTTLRGFQYASALPPYLSRLTGSGASTLRAGDEDQDRLDEEALVDELAGEAGGKARAPFLKRSMPSKAGAGAGGMTSDYEAGGALAAASGLGGGSGSNVRPLGAGVTASVGDTGSLDYADGAEEGSVRMRR